MITILYRNNPQTFFHSLFPLLNSKYISSFSFTDSLDHCLKKDRNEYIILVSWFKYKYAEVENNRKLLTDLKNKYKKVIFFDDSDGADSLHVELIDLVDLYYKKQILADKKKYLKESYGRQQFSDYFHRQYGVCDEIPETREPISDPAQLRKLKIAWNIGASRYPVSRLARKICFDMHSIAGLRLSRYFYPALSGNNPTDDDKMNYVQARFHHAAYSNTIGYQRQLINKIISGRKEIRQGKLERNGYIREQKKALAVISPFGWGEICHRDFEAFVSCTLLIKPNVSHLRTWPDVFIPGVTYLPFSWDGSNLPALIDDILAKPAAFMEVRRSGCDNYYSQLSGMNEHLGEIIDEIIRR